VDQVERLPAPKRGLDQLSPYPRGGGMRGDLEVDELASAVADEKEDVENLES
jgi:hypothetical protein